MCFCKIFTVDKSLSQRGHCTLGKSEISKMVTVSIKNLRGDARFTTVPFKPESEFNEFEPRLKSAKNRFQLSAGLNLETLNTILSGTHHN